MFIDVNKALNAVKPNNKNGVDFKRYEKVREK